MKDIYNKFVAHPVICTDTRKITPDSIFVCLKGDNFDGNTFALQALEAGAAFVITNRQELREHPQCIVVEDTLQTLQQLALYHRQQLNIPVIGITGTNGKTTTKELVSAVLSRKYRICHTQGNLNNHIGVPLTLLTIKGSDELAVVEMGANHPGEIADLCRLSLPDYGLITNIGTAHIEGFLSRENIIDTKKALYRSVIARKGTLFVNLDDEVLTENLNYDRIYTYYTYSCQQTADVQGKIARNDGLITVELFGQTVKTQLTGAYNLSNILSAAAVGRYFKVSDGDICEAIANYRPANHRSQVEHNGSNTIIADYYNANPTSMMAALTNLADIDHSHKIAILGDMRELGSVSDEEHIRIIDFCHKHQIEAYFIGPEFSRHTDTNDCSFANVDEANAYFAQHRPDNALMLVKGSHTIHLEKLILLPS